MCRARLAIRSIAGAAAEWSDCHAGTHALDAIETSVERLSRQEVTAHELNVTGRAPAPGLRLIARTGQPAARNCNTTSRPIWPVAPVTRTWFIDSYDGTWVPLDVTASSSNARTIAPALASGYTAHDRPL